MTRTSQPIRIRRFQPQDAGPLAQLFHVSVRQLGIRAYSQAQVEAWSPVPASASQFLDRVSDDRQVLVAVAPDDTPEGFIELRSDGCIDCFYCNPRSAGTGIGTILYAALESLAQEAGMPMLTVEASEIARTFFSHRGFSCIQKQAFRRNGVLIHNYRMEKQLGKLLDEKPTAT